MTELLDAFFQDFAVDVTAGASTFKAIFDMPDEDLGLALSTEYVITCKASDVSSLDTGSTVTISGSGYSVRGVRKLDDGKIAKVLLSKT